jgi:hypothetical protein
MASYPSIQIPAPARVQTRLLAAPALVAGPLFLAVAALLSLTERDALRTWGWQALDHHGVPWPSGLTLTSHGWLQAASFALTGMALAALTLALRRRLPRRRATTVALVGLAAAAAGLVCAALPLDSPAGDPAQIGSWVQSWHAAVHVVGFVAAGVGGVVAVVGVAVATRCVAPRTSLTSGLVAGVSLSALALPGSLGWYAFLAAFFGWTVMVARGVDR